MNQDNELADLREKLEAHIERTTKLFETIQEGFQEVEGILNRHADNLRKVAMANVALGRAHTALAACVGDSLGHHDDAADLRGTSKEAGELLDELAAIDEH